MMFSGGANFTQKEEEEGKQEEKTYDNLTLYHMSFICNAELRTLWNDSASAWR